MANKTLARDSIYEQKFGTRHRGAGRPTGDVEPLFASAGINLAEVDPVLVNVAKRRAYAVVHEEGRERLAEVFKKELKVLKRRGVQRVAQDSGKRLKDFNDDVDEVVGKGTK